jgi:hypothetical protein
MHVLYQHVDTRDDVPRFLNASYCAAHFRPLLSSTPCRYYINTLTQETSWERPADFDGTFVVIDDATGLTAHTRIDAAVGPRGGGSEDSISERIRG